MPIPVLSGIGDVLNWYQENIGDNVAGTALKIGNEGKRLAGLGDAGTEAIRGMDAHQALDYAYKDNPLGRFALTAVADPLNLVGLGIPGKLATTGLRGVPMLGRGLELAAKADMAPGLLSSKVLDYLGKGAKNTILPMAGTLAPHVDRFAATPLAQGLGKITDAWKDFSFMTPARVAQSFLDDRGRLILHGEGQAALDSTKAVFGGQSSMDRYLAEMGGEVPSAVGNHDPAVTHPSVLPGFLGEWASRGKAAEARYDTATRGTVWGNKAQEYLGEHAGGLSDHLLSQGHPDLANDVLQRQGLISPSRIEAELVSNGHAPAEARRIAEHWQNRVGQAESYADTRTNDLLYKYGGNRWKEAGQELQDGLDPMSAAHIEREAKDYIAADPTNRTYTSFYETLEPGDVLSITGGDRDAARLWEQVRLRARGQKVLDDVGSATFIGSRFAAGSIPDTLRMAGRHPAFANIPAEWYHATDKTNEQAGLSGRYHGSVNVGQMPDWMPLIGGQHVYLNPLEPFASQSLLGTMTEKKNEDQLTDAGRLFEGVGNLGLGINPLLRAGMVATGQLGNKQMTDIVRPLNPIEGVAGAALGRPVDAEGPLKETLAGVEQALTGRQTFPYQEYLVRKRQVELAGGKAAAAQNPPPGIRDQAQHSVANSDAIANFIRTLGFYGLQTLSPEEKQIDQNYVTQAQRAAQTGNPSYAHSLNPTANAYSLVDQLKAKVAMFDKLPPGEQMELMRDPVARELIQKQESNRLHKPSTVIMR